MRELALSSKTRFIESQRTEVQGGFKKIIKTPPLDLPETEEMPRVKKGGETLSERHLGKRRSGGQHRSPNSAKPKKIKGSGKLSQED